MSRGSIPDFRVGAKVSPRLSIMDVIRKFPAPAAIMTSLLVAAASGLPTTGAPA